MAMLDDVSSCASQLPARSASDAQGLHDSAGALDCIASDGCGVASPVLLTKRNSAARTPIPAARGSIFEWFIHPA